MNVLEIEKLNQLVSRTDMTGNQKVEWLVNFIEKRDQALSQHDVSGMLPTEEEIINEAEGRYPVKTHSYPDNSPYVGTQKTFIHGVLWALPSVKGNYR